MYVARNPNFRFTKIIGISHESNVIFNFTICLSCEFPTREPISKKNDASFRPFSIGPMPFSNVPGGRAVMRTVDIAMFHD